jgi:phosphopantetheine--protein transferase-like protein
MSSGIGNDLVWLADPQNLGRHADRLLLQRVLTPAERLLVTISADPDRMLWSLWAAKEAAYKAWSRDEPGAPFSPVSFEVVPEPRKKNATVRRGDWSIPVTWQQGPDWVHAVACDGPTLSRVEAHSPATDQSLAVRTLALVLAAEAGWGKGTIEERPPVFRGSDGTVHPVSLSHDGLYGAACVASAP